jgi:hypothetical protein
MRAPNKKYKFIKKKNIYLPPYNKLKTIKKNKI